jgi:hypothetical protein
MQTNLLHEKIDRYTDLLDSDKFNTQFAREMLLDLKTWITAYEQAFEQQEIDIYKSNAICQDKDEFIELLCNVLIICGYGKAITSMTIMNKDDFRNTIEFLLNCKDRWNGNNIYVIGTLLRVAKRQGIEIKNMIELVNYARTGV